MKPPAKAPPKLELRCVAVTLRQAFEPWGCYVTLGKGRLVVDEKGIMLFPKDAPHKPELFPWSLCGPVSFEYVAVEEPRG